VTRPRSAVIALIHLDRASTGSLREQVYRRLRELIVSRRIVAGTLLPSTRSLASELHVSRNTIVAAFDQLIAEGYVTPKRGAGSYVSATLPDDLTAAPALPRLSLERDRPAKAPSSLRATHAFALGIPAIDEFPYDVWRRLVAKRWRRPGFLAGYGATAGLRALREAIADHVATSRGVSCHAEQLIVVSGTHQAFDLAARVTLAQGDAAWVEDPGYLGAGRVFRAAGARLVPVPVDAEGIDVAAGLALAPRPRIMFVTPSNQFPLGVTMSMPRRHALLAAANKADAWVIEDDYDCEFRYGGRPLPSLHGLDRERRVVYIGSFSKGLLPGLRLAYVVAPPSLVDMFNDVRAVSGSQPSVGDQAVVADFMRDGYFAKHIRRMRELYETRRDCLVAAVRAELGDVVEIETPTAGTHAVAFGRAAIEDTEIAAAAARAGVVALPLSRQYLRPGARSGLLLGYGGVREPVITRGVRTLATTIREMTSPETTRRTAS
jgi:GntR family transcriptional regulator/MocR family aminotransferase